MVVSWVQPQSITAVAASVIRNIFLVAAFCVNVASMIVPPTVLLVCQGAEPNRSRFYFLSLALGVYRVRAVAAEGAGLLLIRFFP